MLTEKNYWKIFYKKNAVNEEIYHWKAMNENV